MRGPSAKPNGNVKVTFKPSTHPKWEVGYGRLLEAHFDGARTLFSDDGRRDRLEPREVRVGETGYPGLAAHDALNLERLRALARSGDSAVPRSFPEFENFLAAWRESNYCLRSTTLSSSFRNGLVERLMGRIEGSIGFEMADDERARRFSLEPLFITQCKVFYEQAIGVPSSLWLGKLPTWERQ